MTTQLAYWSTCAGGPIAYSEYWILANGAVTCIGLFEMNWPIAAMIKISLGYRPNSHAPMNVYYLRHSTDWINAAMRPVHSKWTELELNWSYWVSCPTALGALCAQLTLRLAVVMATELLHGDLACGTLFQSSCVILTSPTDCSDDSWRDTFFGKHEHGTLWLLICGAIEKHLLTCLHG